jgi:hypothetical protein
MPFRRHGHGFNRDSGLRRAGEQRLQRPLRIDLHHPLLLFNREGDCLAAKVQAGNVHSSEDWEELLLPEVERQQQFGQEVVFRADAAFAKPEIYEALEGRGVKYAIRIPANDSLKRDSRSWR